MSERTVIVGMSGGVDSAVTALLLKKEGYQVLGVVLRLWEEEPEGSSRVWTERTCCHVPMVQYLCEKEIGIPFEVIDVAREFQDLVINPFRKGYARAETPNPCMTCNAEIKIAYLQSIARSRGIEKIATGHYARWGHSRDYESTGLRIARDLPKDQSYFLARTRNIRPENFLLPLGERTKEEVRSLAENEGFPVSGLLENQDACFVSEKRVKKFLETGLSGNDPDHEWTATDEHGALLGKLETGIGLTRGQRRGIGISGEKRRYVLRVIPEKKEVVLAPKDRLMESRFKVRNGMGVLFEGHPSKRDQPLFVRFRSTMKPVPCNQAPENPSAFELEHPHDGIVAGQVAVFSDKDGVLAGSGILEQCPRT